MLKNLFSVKFFLVSLIILFFFSVSYGNDKILLSITTDSTPASEKDTLFIVDADGSNAIPLFDFSWNTFDSSGQILDISVSQDGKQIFFSSNNGSMWTPLRKNIFSLNSDGTGVNQLTPLLNSGSWSQACSKCGKVIGTVRKSNGEPWGGALVFLEGMQLINAGVDGSFSFENVPPGVHNLVVYRPGQASAYTFIPVRVEAGITSNVGILNPNSSGKFTLDKPKQYGDFVFYRQTPGNIIKMDLKTGKTIEMYKMTIDGCTLPEVNYDIAPNSGKIIISDYGDGCPGHTGLYVMDNDGNNFDVVANFKINNWCGSGDVFWSPDETKIAVIACYNYYYGIFIIDASTLNIIGTAWMQNNFNPNFINFHLHGWSSDGKYLLYSIWKDSPSQTLLYKADVASLFTQSPSSGLVYQGALSSAAWANLNKPDSLPAPTMTASVSNTNKVNIAWSDVPGASGYTVYFAPYLKAEKIGHANVGKQRKFTFEVPNGSAYYLAVLPYDGKKQSKGFALSNIVQFIVK